MAWKYGGIAFGTCDHLNKGFWLGELKNPFSVKDIWATAWQNQQNGLCAQWRLRSAWASAQSNQTPAQSDQSLPSAWRKVRSLATHKADSEEVDIEDSDQIG